MYHQVHSGTKNCGDYVISLDMLKDDFEYMKDNKINPVSFKMLGEYIKNGTPLPPNPIVITFDDGEKSFITKVVPLLEEYNYPANVNIIGSLTEMYTKNGETNDNYAYLSENDIKALNQNPLVEIGCHTYNLHSLGCRRGIGKAYGESDDTYCSIIKEDIEKFNTLFVKLTGKAPTIFAYPYGIKNKLCEEIIKNNGFTVTLTCRETINKIAPESNLFNLGRFNRPYGIKTKDFFDKILKDI